MSAQRHALDLALLAPLVLLALGPHVAHAQQPATHGAEGCSVAPPVPGAPQDGFALDVQLGFGVGSERWERPAADGTAQELPDSAFAALDAGLRLRLPQTGRFALSTALRYRSSLGYRVEQRPLFALPSEQDVRVQRLELSARAAWLAAAGAWRPTLGIELAVALASFVPELHDRLAPKYALAGPVLRPFGALEPVDWLSLELGPELWWIAVVDGDLRDDGVRAQGFGLGAEAKARARVAPGFALELDFRSGVAFVDSRGDRVDFESAERFLTLGVVGEL